MPLSYSQLATYKRCPKQYEFAYVKKIPRQISRGESFGSSIHNTLKRWGELEMKHSAPQLKPNQLELFTREDHIQHLETLDFTTLANLWRSCFIAEGYPSRAEMDAFLLRGEQALMHFYDWWKSKPRQVVGVEKSFKLEIISPHEKTAMTMVSGRLDRVELAENGLSIIDFKSTAPRSQDEANADLQLSIYALATQEIFNEPVKELTLLFIGEDECTAVSTQRNPSQLRDAQTGISLLAKRMDDGDFGATPSVPKCRHCPYREICPARAV